MSNRVSLEVEKKATGPKRLTPAEYDEKHVAIQEHYGMMLAGRAGFVRDCHDVEVYETHLHHKCKTEEEYIIKTFQGQKMSVSIFREAKRIFKSFLDGANKFPEFREDPEKAGNFVEKKLDRLYKTVENNATYVSELARTNIFGETKERAEQNIDEVKEIYAKSKDSADFIKRTRKAFGVKNPDKVAASKKRTDRDVGSKIGLNARVSSTMMVPIVQMFDAVSKEAGISTPYAELTSDDLGNMLYNVAMKAKALYPTSLKTQADRKNAGGILAKAMVKVLSGADLSDGQLDDLMDRVMPIVEQVVGEG
jgi:hypothetical protein